ncbi:hypothetical protein [Maricaulis maris]|uniref:hypothetical protein n=1 Tax=Maricaulis maris TaxID=74318 RepID=UPI003A945BC0
MWDTLLPAELEVAHAYGRLMLQSLFFINGTGIAGLVALAGLTTQRHPDRIAASINRLAASLACTALSAATAFLSAYAFVFAEKRHNSDLPYEDAARLVSNLAGVAMIITVALAIWFSYRGARLLADAVLPREG